MTDRRLERWAPLSGLIFLGLLIAGFVISGDTPDVDDSTQDVISFWSDHQDANTAGAILGALAALFLVWFAGVLRASLRRPMGSDDRLPTVAFGGFLILAVGLLSNSAIQLAAADSVGDVPDEVTQALSVLYSDFFFPMAAGIVLGVIASGMAILRYRSFPTWLGWAGVAIGITFIPLWFIGGPLAGIWVIVASVLMLRNNTDQPAAVHREPA